MFVSTLYSLSVTTFSPSVPYDLILVTQKQIECPVKVRIKILVKLQYPEIKEVQKVYLN